MHRCGWHGEYRDIRPWRHGAGLCFGGLWVRMRRIPACIPLLAARRYQAQACRLHSSGVHRLATERWRQHRPFAGITFVLPCRVAWEKYSSRLFVLRRVKVRNRVLCTIFGRFYVSFSFVRIGVLQKYGF